jgi:hypothetical protein
VFVHFIGHFRDLIAVTTKKITVVLSDSDSDAEITFQDAESQVHTGPHFPVTFWHLLNVTLQERRRRKMVGYYSHLIFSFEE